MINNFGGDDRVGGGVGRLGNFTPPLFLLAARTGPTCFLLLFSTAHVVITVKM